MATFTWRLKYICIFFYVWSNIFILAAEWNCATTTNAGIYTRSDDCQISGNNHVEVTDSLEITGGNVDRLVTITPAANHRHFFVNGGNLTLRFLTLSGGDVYYGQPCTYNGIYTDFRGCGGGAINLDG